MGSAEDVASAYGAQSEQPLARPQSKLVEANQRAQKKQKVSTTKSVISSVKKTSLYHSTAKRIPNVERTAGSVKKTECKKYHCLIENCNKCGNRRAEIRDLTCQKSEKIPNVKLCSLERGKEGSCMICATNKSKY